MSLRPKPEHRRAPHGPHRHSPALHFVNVAHIHVTRSAFASMAARDLARSNCEVVTRLLNGFVEPHEINADAMRAFMIEVYACDVLAGGHGRFATAMQGQKLMIQFLREGLAAARAHDHCVLFEIFLARTDDRAGFRDLDESFHALEAARSLSDLCGAWLRGQPMLRVIEDGRLDALLDETIHGLPCSRAFRPGLLGAMRMRQDPHSLLAERLCDLAAREWQGWTGRVPLRLDDRPGPAVEVLAWSTATAEGPCLLYFRDGRAFLRDQHTGRILASLPLQG